MRPRSSSARGSGRARSASFPELSIYPRPGRGPRGGGALIDDVFREEWGRVLASLIGYLGDFDLAEEAAQEAFTIAAERWPRDGTPRSPGAWLITTARNRAIDRIRRDRTL